MFRCTVPVAAVAALLVAASSVSAQPTPTWNRKVEGIAVSPVPVAGSFFSITGYASIDADNVDTQIDLSTEIEILINGTTAYIEQKNLVANPGTHADCSGLDCGAEPCFCTEPPVVCECGPIIISVETTTALQPEDEIMVLLRPAPGALPDDDESDDLDILMFAGDPIFWNRTILSIDLMQAKQQGFVDAFVAIALTTNYSGGLNLTAIGELLVNGVPMMESATGPTDLVWSFCDPGCGASCATDGGVPAGICQSDVQGPLDCACQSTLPTLVFPSIPVEPDDELTILLRPAPGALPELPGFPDDEETRPVCPWDCGDGDFIVGITDFLAMLATWGEVGAACDFDGDGVGITDFLKLLGQWGPCFPM
jgi:hypothetical protein